MRMTDSQWKAVSFALDKGAKSRPESGSARALINGVLWIINEGLHTKLMPADYPAYGVSLQKLHSMLEDQSLYKVLVSLVRHLRAKTGIDLTKTFIDKGLVSCPPDFKGWGQGRTMPDWVFATLDLFTQAYPLRVVHTLRLERLVGEHGWAVAATLVGGLTATEKGMTQLLEGEFYKGCLVPLEGQTKIDWVRAYEDGCADFLDGQLLQREGGRMGAQFLDLVGHDTTKTPLS